MDAPTTTSADSGTSGDNGGWFTPRKKPQPSADSEARQAPDGEAQGPGRDQHQEIPQARSEAPTQDVRAPGEPVRDGRERESRVPPPRAFSAWERAPRTPEPAPHGPTRTLEEAPSAEPMAGRPALSTVEPSTPVADRAATAAEAPASAVQAPATAVQAAAVATAEPTTAAEALAPAVPTRQTQSTAPIDAPSGTTSAASAPDADQGTSGSARTATTTPTKTASPDAILIQRTMAEVAPVADKVTSYFYALLFVRHPDLRMLFPASMDTQRDRLLKALLTAAENVDNTDVLVAYLKNLGRGHRKYGTEPEHYPAVGEALIGSLSRYASHIWNEETEAAWVRTYTTISQVMIDAAAEDQLRAPAWWFGEVVSHDLRTSDIAVVTVRPDQPYPFLAGQYTSLETPWWPRVWRHYSFASAPRSDGLLSFHVKAVPTGWVSNALVHRARPGDIVRLGPPTGNMTVDHGKDNGLLCLGGGTGIAPIKALIEDVAEHGERRPVEVFYGARTDHDLYDIDTMLRLEQYHPWLSVRPVVDSLAQQAQLPDAVREYGPWTEYDAYLSGPPGMIRSGVHALRDIGIPSERIRHDSVEELVASGD